MNFGKAAAVAMALLASGPALSSGHGADRDGRTDRGETWDAWGSAGLSPVFWSDPALDELGTQSGRDWWVDSRVIAGASYRWNEAWKLELEVEGLNGPAFGETTDIGLGRGGKLGADDSFLRARHGARDIQQVLPRKLNVARGGIWGVGTAGIDTIHWGTGMLANDGLQEQAFGESLRGNIAARAGVLVAPFGVRDGSKVQKLAFFAAADMPLRDEGTDFFLGDRAYAALGAVRWAYRWTEAGVFTSYRWQEDRDDPLFPGDEPSRVAAVPVDLWIKHSFPVKGRPYRIQAEAELARIHGRTDRPYTVETLEDGAKLQSLGALGRLRLDHDPLGLTAVLEAGYASGDNDMRDGTIRAFRFHSDHNVGLVLFDHVLPLMTARSTDRVGDPGLLGQAPPSTRFTIAQGGVENAIYVNQVARLRVAGPVEIKAGWLWARSAADMADIYHSNRLGGYNATYGAVQPGSRDLGTELDFGAEIFIAAPGAMGIELDLEGGLFLPGEAFTGVGSDTGPGTTWLGQSRLKIHW